LQVSKTLAIDVTGFLAIDASGFPRQVYAGKNFPYTIKWTPLMTEDYEYRVDYGDGTGHVDITYNQETSFKSNKTYTTPGTYTVKVDVTGFISGSSGHAEFTVTVGEPLSVTFNVDDATPVAGQTVNFSGRISKGFSPYRWNIDFGDGASTGWQSGGTISASHAYSKVGSYTATLVAEDALGTAQYLTVRFASVNVLPAIGRIAVPAVFGLALILLVK